MAWTEIPGWRQDHKGRIYSVLRNSQGRTDIRYHPTPTLPPARAKLYEPITVHSQGYDAWLGVIPENDIQRKMKEMVLERGPTYESIVFFHSGNISI